MIVRQRYQGWSDDAAKAMTDNPTYFVWWYSAKSIALVAAIGLAAYWYGRSRR